MIYVCIHGLSGPTGSFGTNDILELEADHEYVVKGFFIPEADRAHRPLKKMKEIPPGVQA